MIQRIQTVFLLLAIVFMGLFLWLPLIELEWNAQKVQSVPGWEINHFGNGYSYFVNLIFVGTAAGLALINIFLFKKRPLQMLVCWFAVIFVAAGQAFVFYKYQTRVFPGFVMLTVWNLFSAAAALSLIAAFAFIRKDEETIKSLDRLR